MFLIFLYQKLLLEKNLVPAPMLLWIAVSVFPPGVRYFKP